jgi:hypothetical protein
VEGEGLEEGARLDAGDARRGGARRGGVEQRVDPRPAIPDDGVPLAEIEDAVPRDVPVGHEGAERDLARLGAAGLVADDEPRRVEAGIPPDAMVGLAARAHGGER